MRKQSSFGRSMEKTAGVVISVLLICALFMSLAAPIALALEEDAGGDNSVDYVASPESEESEDFEELEEVEEPEESEESEETEEEEESEEPEDAEE